MIVESAREDFLRRPNTYAVDHYGRLYASEIGGCRRKVSLRLAGTLDTVSPSIKGLNAMHNGVIMENDTARALLYHYGERNVVRDLEIKTALWSVKMDFVLFHHGGSVLHEDSDTPIIIEHKWTSSWRDSNERLPYSNHAQQLAVYGHLYKQKFGVKPRMILYYRTHKNYTELFLEDKGDHLVLDGVQDGEYFQKFLTFSLADEMEQMEKLTQLNAEMPPVFSGNGKLENCRRFGEPSCRYYYTCFPDERTFDEIPF